MPRRDPSRRRHPDGRTYRPSAQRWAVAAAADRPYPVDALAVAIGVRSDDPCLRARLAEALQLNPTTVRRYRAIGGLTRAQAEAWADRAGVHPREVWEGWDDETTEEAPAPDWLRAS